MTTAIRTHRWRRTFAIPPDREFSDDRSPIGLVIDVAVDGETTVLTLSGELDIAARSAMADATRGIETRRIVVDVSGLGFIDVRGLQTLLALRVAAESDDGTMVLRNPSAAVVALLSLCGLDAQGQDRGPLP